jgi:hypothetical protein
MMVEEAEARLAPASSESVRQGRSQDSGRGHVAAVAGQPPVSLPQKAARAEISDKMLSRQNSGEFSPMTPRTPD